MYNQKMSAIASLEETKKRHLNCFYTEIGCNPIEVKQTEKGTFVYWGMSMVLFLKDYKEEKDYRGNVWTHYTAEYNTYVGWKLYMLLTGCMASKPKEEGLTYKGIDSWV